MGKLEYLDALRRAMAGIPAETQASTLAWYEQRFIDGVAAGRTEADIAAELDEPTQVAMKLRTTAHMHSFEQKKNPANLMRLLVSLAGLAIFNLFMVVPALVYAAFLALLYAAGLAFYVAGIAITASGLSGANELVLDGPFRELILSDTSGDERDTMEVKVSISQDGVRFFREHISGDAPRHVVATAHAAAAEAARAAGEVARAADEVARAGREAARAAGEAVRASGEAAARVDEDDDADADAEDEEDEEAAPAPPKKRGMVRRAEEAASGGLRITTNLEPGSRATQTIFGLGIVLAGIVIFLLCLVITKYTLTGIRRYAEMNVSLLKGN
ncbi:DUF1700 domain-containing protein [Massilia sp. P8910]|uniref:DUF1700 domain-containing protein n=1 Tax=Massilia antarctica TaxID=2765360 RepID=UPI001E2F358B|nr:DUF1700 domain-containing protein [Massilia antarctica]MCE3602489.1 DUF1700 domain-containing protein [Massilia antarctica]